MKQFRDYLAKAQSSRHEEDVKRYRIFLLLGFVIYPAWWFPFHYQVSGARDLFAERLAIGLLCFGLFALTFFSRLALRYLSRLFLLCALLMISHVFYLIVLNPNERHYIMHAFVASLAIGSCLISHKQLLVYSIYVFLLGIASAFVLLDFSRMIFILGLATGLMISYVAVGSRLKLLKTILNSEEKLRKITDHAPAMIWMSDENGFLSFFNRSWLTFTGKSTDDSVGNGWTQCIHPEDLNRYLEVYFKAFRGRCDFRTEYRLRRADGTFRSIFSQGSPLYEPHGKFIGYIGSCTDVTERG